MRRRSARPLSRQGNERLLPLAMVAAASAGHRRVGGRVPGCGAVLPWVARWLDVGAPQGADAIMLLTGDAETRPFAAAALWKAGWAPRILISTVARDPQHERTSIPADDELNLRVLWACGVPPSAVSVLDGQAASTYDEALAAAAYLGRSAPQRLLVVTNGFHARRARWIFRRVLAGRAARITLVAAAKDDLPAEAWWQSAGVCRHQRGIHEIGVLCATI